MSHANSGPSSSSSNNWRNPSLAQQQKYNIRPVPEGFVPTLEEQQLLDMYEVLRSHERVAARLKEEAARAKLMARDAEFQQQKQQLADQRRTNKRARKKVAENDDDDDLDQVSDEDDYDDEDSEDFEEEKTLHDRRQEKLDELRIEVEAKKNALNAASSGQDDALRAKLLEVTETIDDEPMLKKKKLTVPDSSTAGPSSLIANLGATKTPTHDFSEKLGLAQARGSVLFPKGGEFQWTPPEGVSNPNEGAFQVELPDFDIARAQNASGNNTVAIKCTIPSDSRRFSINIANSDHNDFASVLFHFNPRQRVHGGQLVINDKQEGTWGNALTIPLSQVPLMFGQDACTILIQINGEGFDIFVEHVHCARLEHRSELPVGPTKLVLQFPSTDDSSAPENWTVYKVWWGQRPILVKGDVSHIPGVNSFNADHPRKLFISGLPRIISDAEVEIRRAELERAFRKYGGDRGVQVIVPMNVSYAFVEMESESMTDLALKEMSDVYRMNRARRSRHEALREERAAREAMNLGATSNAWD